MRATYRSHGGSRDYWERRWSQIPADAGDLNLDRYPGKYAEPVMNRAIGMVLEAGCGAGRVLLHYHHCGKPIIGMDFIETACAKIHAREPTVPVYAGDIARLPFADAQFGAVLAFGLYHNLEHGAEKALLETRRVLTTGGLLCASVRVDNIQNRIVDWLADRNQLSAGERAFHKANYRHAEISQMLTASGFEIERVEYVVNMPLAYKFRPLRHRSHRKFDEHVARGEGYRLSWFGAALQNTLVTLFPRSFCNIMVATARAV